MVVSVLRIPGWSVKKHTEIGSYVNVGNPVVTLISDTEIEVEAEVPSDRIAGLSPGTIVRFRLDDGTDHRATVRSIIPREKRPNAYPACPVYAEVRVKNHRVSL